MSEHLEIIDFDRTTYDTDAFTDALLISLEENRLINDVQHDSLKEAFVSPDTVDIVELITSQGISVDELRDLILNLEGDFVYPDAREFYDTCEDALILTTAASIELQRFKITQSGIKRPFKIITGNKGLFLSRHLQLVGAEVSLDVPGVEGPFSSVAVNDDKFEAIAPAINLPGVSKLRVVQREDAKYQISDDEVRELTQANGEVIHSFEEVITKAA